MSLGFDFASVGWVTSGLLLITSNEMARRRTRPRDDVQQIISEYPSLLLRDLKDG